ncbi:hypothetical protein B484DRAFT_426316 [Ochromonadaceae sp. CCMP2298]|nr:hypothetical protein B484DRAFT_426316 [Ochromonadaceae sp. CCMP2298]
MFEHEFAVTLYSLGRLGAQWSHLPDFITDKLDHRITRVARFLTSQSLANTLQGLASMGLVWGGISADSRDALLMSMLLDSPTQAQTQAQSRSQYHQSTPQTPSPNPSHSPNTPTYSPNTPTPTYSSTPAYPTTQRCGVRGMGSAERLWGG